MGIGKHYDGYRSFQYLTPGKDYKAFELTPELDRVEPYRVPLSEDEERRAETLLANTVMISLHEHVGLFPADISETPAMVKEGRMATAFEGLAASCWDAVLDNLLDGIGSIHSRHGWQWEDVVHDLWIIVEHPNVGADATDRWVCL